MSYFSDRSLHTYTPTGGIRVLNVGWLDQRYPFTQGKTSLTFRRALRRLCEKPIYLHRGFHVCEFCPPKLRNALGSRMGNGQIRIKGSGETWFAAPTMIHHYVIAHNYLPPPEFVEAVLHPAAIAEDDS